MTIIKMDMAASLSTFSSALTVFFFFFHLDTKFHVMGLCLGLSAAKRDPAALQNDYKGGSGITEKYSGSFSSGLLASKRDTPFTTSLKSFTFSDLKNATKNFPPETMLGEGGFGRVFKGWIDENTFSPTKPGTGMVVAVKKHKAQSFQGHKEWLTEVNYLGMLHHKNLVTLIGYCSESENRLLVYEFMPKGSLENHLFRKGVQLMPWPIRFRIAVDVARGLSFLHSLHANVIYRDLKASNILLDSEFNAKLSDFGLAREGPRGDRTHVSTRVLGTRGYAAPEYVATGHLTPKSDVYSYGVVLLELLSGKRAGGDEDTGGADETLVEWARPFLVDNRRVLRIMDTKLGGQYSKKCALSMAAIALGCLHVDARYRPPMTEVLAALEELQAPRDVTNVLGRANKENYVANKSSRPTTMKF